MSVRTGWRVVVCGLLMASGGLTIAASGQRWRTCRPYEFAAPSCVPWRDSRYDYLAPTAPWVPIGNSAQVAGVGLILLAVAVLVLPRMLTPEAPRWLAWCLGATLASGACIVGVITLLAGQAGRPVGESLILPSGLLWLLGWQVAMMALFVLIVIDSGLLRWRVSAICLLLSSTPLGTYIITAMLFVDGSEGTTPWTEAVGGALTVLAAAAVWLGTGRANPAALTRAREAHLDVVT